MNRRLAIAGMLAALCAPRPALALEDVPYVTTPDRVTLAMLQAAKVGPQDYVIDLGSGDGRIVILAARRFGASGLGVEIVPDLVAQSRENARNAGVEARARFREGDLFDVDLSPATVVTLYLLPDVNLQLRPRLLALVPGTRIVSHDWDMGDWKPDKTITIDVPEKQVGLEKVSRVHLWIVPARIAGEWCGSGAARGSRLAIRQDFQHLRGELVDASGEQAFVGQLDGRVLRGARLGGAAFDLREDRKRLLVTRKPGRGVATRAAVFTRREGAACK